MLNIRLALGMVLAAAVVVARLVEAARARGRHKVRVHVRLEDDGRVRRIHVRG